MAGESSAVPLEAAYLDGIIHIVGRDSDARVSTQRGDNTFDLEARPVSAQRGDRAGEANTEESGRKRRKRLILVNM